MKKASKPAPRKPRADAQRNRERLLEIAHEAFTREGAQVSLDDIAKRAGVGPGTLYRHFPTRDNLLEAVYHKEVDKLAAAEKELAAKLSPVEALRAWMRLFVDCIATKKLIAPALNNLIQECPKAFEASGVKIKNTIRVLVHRAIETGDIRSDIEPLDLLRALVGVSYVSTETNWKESALRLVDILIAGSRRN